MKAAKRIKELKAVFRAGLKCGKLHPDDNSYDKVHFENALKKLNIPNSKKTLTQ